MKVKITFTNGHVLTGRIEQEVSQALQHRALDWILNDERKFIPLQRPDGTEIQIQKNAIQSIVEEK